MNEPLKKRTGTRTAENKAPDAAISQNNRIVIGTICSVLLSVALAVSFLTPFLFAAALAPFFYEAMKKGDVRTAFNLTLRWSILLFVCVATLAVYLPDRTAGSIPLAEGAIENMAAWVTGAKSEAPLGAVAIMAGVAIFALASLLSGGLGAIIIGATALGCAACTFTVLVRHGENIVQMAAIGNPPWIIACCAAGLLLLIPTALPFYRKLIGAAPLKAANGSYVRSHIIIGVSLIFVSIACALLLDGSWQRLLSAYTVW